MKPANQLMKDYLKDNGIIATPKYTEKGSLKNTWNIYNRDIKWYDNSELWAKLTTLGFVSHDGKIFNQFSGNGGVFSIIARYKGTNENLLHPNIYNKCNSK